MCQPIAGEMPATTSDSVPEAASRDLWAGRHSLTIRTPQHTGHPHPVQSYSPRHFAADTERPLGNGWKRDGFKLCYVEQKKPALK
jgi:hypothetical protein